MAGAVFLASTVQIISGFGFALLCVPLMTLAIDTRTAVVVSTLTGVVVMTFQAWRERANAEPVLVRRLTLATYAGMPLGLFIFNVVSENTLRLILGIAVCVAVVFLARRIDLAHASGRLEAGAGFVSGVLTTSLSTSGPPLVFALQARQLPADRFRATISAVFALSNVGAVAAFLADGDVTRRGLVAAAASVPAVYLGQFAGRPLRSRLHGEAFRRLVLALLIAAAASAILHSL